MVYPQPCSNIWCKYLENDRIMPQSIPDNFKSPFQTSSIIRSNVYRHNLKKQQEERNWSRELQMFQEYLNIKKHDEMYNFVITKNNSEMTKNDPNIKRLIYKDLRWKYADSEHYYILFIIEFLILIAIIIFLKREYDKAEYGSPVHRLPLFSSHETGTSQRPSLPTMPDFANNPLVIPDSIHLPVVPNNLAAGSSIISGVMISTRRSDSTENPPGYEDVLLNDFCGNKEFPKVNPSVPETPPPNYEDYTMSFKSM